MRKVFYFVIALAFVVLLSASPGVAADAPFYQGKTLTLIVGYPPGGGYGGYAVLISRHLAKHIPGNPTIVVQYMPGGGSMVAANHLFNRATPDGLTIGTVAMGQMFASQIAKSEGVRFDLAQWKFIGNAAVNTEILITRSDSPYATLEALKKAKQPARIGYLAKGDNHHMFGVVIEEALGIRFNSIFGYRGGGEADLGLERGELDGRTVNLNTYLIQHPDWIQRGFVKILVQGGVPDENGKTIRDPTIPNIPLILELSSSPKVKKLHDFTALGTTIGRLYVAPPKTPDDKVEILRKAFLAALKDPELKAEAEKLKIDITPMGAKQVEAVLKDALAADQETVEFFKKIKE